VAGTTAAAELVGTSGAPAGTQVEVAADTEVARVEVTADRGIAREEGLADTSIAQAGAGCTSAGRAEAGIAAGMPAGWAEAGTGTLAHDTGGQGKTYCAWGECCNEKECVRNAPAINAAI
jgi:hypothetical protein